LFETRRLFEVLRYVSEIHEIHVYAKTYQRIAKFNEVIAK